MLLRMVVLILALVLGNNIVLADIYKCNNDDGTIKYSNVLKEGCEKLRIIDKRWELLKEDAFADTALYLDSKSIKKRGGIVDFWLMQLENNEQIKSHFKISCSNRVFSKTQGEGFTAFEGNKIINISPESDIELAYSKLCAGK